MTVDIARAAVITGDGVVARFPGLLCVARCSDRDVLLKLLDVCAAAAGSDPGRALARRLAKWMGGPDAPGDDLEFGTVATTGNQLGVFLVGAVAVAVPGSSVSLSGSDAATWTDRLIAVPGGPVVLALDGARPPADLADGINDLRAGVVPGAGAVLFPVGRAVAPRSEPTGASALDGPTIRTPAHSGSVRGGGQAAPAGSAAAHEAAVGNGTGPSGTGSNGVTRNGNARNGAPSLLADEATAAEGERPRSADPRPPNGYEWFADWSEGGADPAIATADTRSADTRSADTRSADTRSAETPGADAEAPAEGRWPWAESPAERARVRPDDGRPERVGDGSADDLRSGLDGGRRAAFDDGHPAASDVGRPVGPDDQRPDASDDGRPSPFHDGRPGAPEDARPGAVSEQRPGPVSDQRRGPVDDGRPGAVDGRRPGAVDGRRLGAAGQGRPDVADGGPTFADEGRSAFVEDGRPGPAGNGRAEAAGPGSDDVRPGSGEDGRPGSSDSGRFGPSTWTEPPTPTGGSARSAPAEERPQVWVDPAILNDPADQLHKGRHAILGLVGAGPVDQQQPAEYAPAFAPPTGAEGSGYREATPADAPPTLDGADDATPVNAVAAVEPEPAAVAEAPVGEPDDRAPDPEDGAAPRPTPAPRPQDQTGPAEALPDTDEPLLHGLLCEDGHLNDPRSSSCLVCGAPVEPGDDVVGPRPPLGRIVFDDGAAFTVDAEYLVGRMPEADPRARSGELLPIVVEDRSGSVSRVHAEILINGWDVVLVDSGSRNGTFVAGPDDSGWTPLAPGRTSLLLPGTRVRMGGRTFVFEPPVAVG